MDVLNLSYHFITLVIQAMLHLYRTHTTTYNVTSESSSWDHSGVGWNWLSWNTVTFWTLLLEVLQLNLRNYAGWLIKRLQTGPSNSFSFIVKIETHSSKFCIQFAILDFKSTHSIALQYCSHSCQSKIEVNWLKNFSHSQSRSNLLGQLKGIQHSSDPTELLRQSSSRI